jgi:hypothetical protein
MRETLSILLVLLILLDFYKHFELFKLQSSIIVGVSFLYLSDHFLGEFQMIFGSIFSVNNLVEIVQELLFCVCCETFKLLKFSPDYLFTLVKSLFF